METTSCDQQYICSACARPLPRSEFRRRSKGSDARMSKCRECHSAYERARRKKVQLKKNGKTLAKFATQIANSRRYAKIANLTELMVSTLGGPERFFEVWKSEIDRVRTHKRRTLYALKYCESMIREHEAVLRAGNSFVESEEDQRAGLLHCLRRLFLTDRAVMERAAKQAGCKITWHTNTTQAEAS